MADVSSRQSETEEKKLKYLDFFRCATAFTVACVSRVYDYAKENSGPLKPGVQTVEGSVKTVLGPVYQKLHHLPSDLLFFADGKVDDTVSKLDSYVPPLVKTASSQLCAAASEVRRSGVTEAVSELYTKYEPVGRDLYTKYEPVAEHYAVSAWEAANRLPLFPHVAQIIVLSASYWSERYNDSVLYASQTGYHVAQYLPFIPTDRIAKVFKGRAQMEMEPIHEESETDVHQESETDVHVDEKQQSTSSVGEDAPHPSE
ncbi:stress-related protein isoform X2 [Amborella trichopoda]|uniref:stress-related protein isoform X2 n=1 Tax=Amborella trichopoda TaxID=13333 RepID=UPI0005D36783|nr:stress-related protein isoform X2 [Amborella trichopoda]|eukprot:XP_006840520.2 stress-related protein isoform X2 [Amborella trichopoda]